MRTDLDFSKHVLEIEENELIKIHHLRIPNSRYNNFKFINTCGHLFVTGDYGDWMFCREFIPSANESKVYDDYWAQKARIGTTQVTHEFDSESTIKSLEELINECDDANTLEVLTEAKETLKLYGQYEYEQYMNQNAPSHFDSESIPNCTKIKYHLKAVFDAFEEVCKRLNANGQGVVPPATLIT